MGKLTYFWLCPGILLLRASKVLTAALNDADNFLVGRSVLLQLVDYCDVLRALRARFVELGLTCPLK